MLKILAIDNEKNNLKALIGCLKTIYPGSHIIPFKDAMLSVQYGYNYPVDMIYTNVILHHITGLQVMKLLRKVHPALAVNFVANTDEYTEAAAALGADGYYLTPVSEESLFKGNLLSQTVSTNTTV